MSKQEVWEGWEVWEDREKIFPPSLPTLPHLPNTQSPIPSPQLHITQLGENYVITSNSQKREYRH
ncbi:MULTISPECIES: hypothetical protein [Nostoc]|uniref:Uncharacterized protein n=1 Tax=Nostoc paludosum FACHB-159 TaxID=2692908 RepID=A0ABR8KBK3_9NOSO|nr:MULTISPECIES: hypothetical protein [Nostoc]MBD2736278.1 hypothetical protein [Nostoc paludosum FACHB-159]